MTSLPYTWNWCIGGKPAMIAGRPGPDWQRVQMDLGDKIQPLAFLDAIWTWAQIGTHATHAVNAAKAYGLPVCFRTDNLFYDMKRLPLFAGESLDPLLPNDHGWFVYDNLGTPDTLTTHLSPWSKKALVYAYDLGYLYGTCPEVVESAKLYRNPPLVVIFDNNEAGLNWKTTGVDVREDALLGLLRTNLANAVGDYDISFATEAVREMEDKLYGYAESKIKEEFGRGWEDGLATHSTIWARRSGFCAYSGWGENQGTNIEADVGGNLRTSFFSSLVTSADTGLPDGGAFGGHKFGISGSSYLSTYGDTVLSGRPWFALSSQRARREAGLLQSGIRGVGRGLQSNLTWEGEGASLPDTPNNWLGWTRANLWMNAVGIDAQWVMNGHFASSTQTTAGNAIAVYYRDVIDAVNEVHLNATLSNFWKNGKLIQSVDPDQYVKHKHHPFSRRIPWYWQHVTENNRYGAAFPSETSVKLIRLELEEFGRTNDTWKNDLTSSQLINTAVMAIQWGGKLLILAIGTASTQTNVTARIPIGDNLINFVIPSAPIEGKFYTANLDGTGITLIL